MSRLVRVLLHRGRMASGWNDAGTVSAPTRPLSVLVVEDDSDLRVEIADLLEHEGHRVRQASHGGEALEILGSESSIDLILLDLWMPTMDGWTFRVRQREDPSIRGIPVIVLTADDGAQARAIDADAYLRKPFEAGELREIVREIAGQRRAEVTESADLVAKTVSLLSSAVSHEVANPLMTIIAQLERHRAHTAQLGEAKEDDTETAHLLEECWRIADSLRTLRALPFPSWASEGEVDVARQLLSALGSIRHDSLRVHYELDNAAQVQGAPLVVLYVCSTLLRHAIEAFPVGTTDDDPGEPHVIARVTRVGPEVLLDVVDRGPPIPSDEIDQIFTMGYCGRTRAWSAGLRLWWVRQAVESLGGEVSITNRIPTGVRCRVRFPAAPKRGRADEGSSVESRPVDPADPGRGAVAQAHRRQEHEDAGLCQPPGPTMRSAAAGPNVPGS